MLKVVILDNRLERLNRVVDVLRNKYNVDVVQVYYYEEHTGFIHDLNAPVDKLNIWNFRDTLDEWYDNGAILLFNTDLGEHLEENVFSYRVQVGYAMSLQKITKDYNIWFYTLAGEKSREEVEDIFPEHVIDVTVIDGQLDLDIQNCPTLYKAMTVE